MEPLRKIGVNQLPTEAAEIVVLRTQLLDLACIFEHEICSETAQRLFAEWIAASTPPEKIPYF